MRPTACMSRHSRNVGPRRALLLQVDRRRHVHERQRHELGEPAGLLLQRHACARCDGPTERGCSIEPNMMVTFERRPDPMGGAVGIEPLLGVDLVGAQDRADLVVEDLGGGARQRAQTGVLQPRAGTSSSGSPRRRAPSVTSSAVKRVHVDVGHRFLHRPGDVDVVVAVEVGVDAALQAHLGRAELGGLDGAALRSRRGRAGTGCRAGSATAGPSRSRRTCT